MFIFLHAGDVVELHDKLVQTFGGSHGLRDAGLLASAVAQAQTSIGGHYLHPTIAEIAATRAGWTSAPGTTGCSVSCCINARVRLT